MYRITFKGRCVMDYITEKISVYGFIAWLIWRKDAKELMDNW